jgi:hypothetical protein
MSRQHSDRAQSAELTVYAKHSFRTLKAHIFQINELIEDTGYRIEGRGAARLVRRCAQKS